MKFNMTKFNFDKISNFLNSFVKTKRKFYYLILISITIIIGGFFIYLTIKDQEAKKDITKQKESSKIISPKDIQDIKKDLTEVVSKLNSDSVNSFIETSNFTFQTTHGFLIPLKPIDDSTTPKDSVKSNLSMGNMGYLDSLVLALKIANEENSKLKNENSKYRAFTSKIAEKYPEFNYPDVVVIEKPTEPEKPKEIVLEKTTKRNWFLGPKKDYYKVDDSDKFKVEVDRKSSKKSKITISKK